jgi:hypothetical protein
MLLQGARVIIDGKRVDVRPVLTGTKTASGRVVCNEAMVISDKTVVEEEDTFVDHHDYRECCRTLGKNVEVSLLPWKRGDLVMTTLSREDGKIHVETRVRRTIDDPFQFDDGLVFSIGGNSLSFLLSPRKKALLKQLNAIKLLENHDRLYLEGYHDKDKIHYYHATDKRGKEVFLPGLKMLSWMPVTLVSAEAARDAMTDIITASRPNHLAGVLLKSGDKVYHYINSERLAINDSLS